MKRINNISSQAGHIADLVPDQNQPRVYIETYGCQMNVADSEVVLSILVDNGYSVSHDPEQADVILINTCSIRDKAERKVFRRLDLFDRIKKNNPDILVGVIGCMAERLKEQLVNNYRVVDIVIGPDAYRKLPELIDEAGTGQKAVNVLLSREETYADISPVRMDKNHVTAFISIMRGCNNMCTYCVVPYTRGGERSRDPQSILREVDNLIKSGYKEVTLIGQNVDSYKWKENGGNIEVSFSGLLNKLAEAMPDMRIRFSTSHPKDLPDEVLSVMSRYNNICKHIHLPLQSGNNRILDLMNRGYTSEWYIGRINAIKRILPDCSISTDIITGFCSETEEEHKETLSLMEWVGYDFAYMFKYSERPGTKAARKLKDDVPEEVKSRRLTEIIELQNKLSHKAKIKDLNRVYEVLVEGVSKKSDNDLFGRTSQNKVVVFPARNYKPGDTLKVRINNCTSATLLGEPV
ncbi:MAG: tRNA (N6-isopentenyl adenosine(37)-C2)-methylthiotransferase MiaB [Bacteroidetes bacterium]|nr:tRNA (N6-isopentenyl adenosine(37)-C2)-methylthiotransferase MiaB [Bacteroidota bacterium]